MAQNHAEQAMQALDTLELTAVRRGARSTPGLLTLSLESWSLHDLLRRGGSAVTSRDHGAAVHSE